MFDFIAETFNNREIALGIWLFVFITWLLYDRKMRKAIISYVNLFLGKTILKMLFAMLIYISTLIFIFYRIDLWNMKLLKETIYWTFGIAFIMLINANKANENEEYFRNIIKDNVKLIIILEFIINLYCFSIIWELLFLTIMLILILMQTFSENKKEFKLIQQIINVTLSIIGVTYLIIAIYHIFIDLTNFVSFNNLRSFLFAPILTILYLPFIYFMALFMQYETLFIRLSFRLAEKKSILKYAKFQIFKFSQFNLKKLNNFTRAVPIYKFDSKEEITKTIQDYIKDIKKRNII